MPKHIRFIFEHRCPDGLCSRQGEQITVYPRCDRGVAYLDRIVCIESGCDLWLVEQVMS